MSHGAPQSNGLEWLEAVWSRRKWLALVAFSIPFTSTVSVVTFLPNVYRSSATVLIEREQVPEAFVRPTVTSEVETRLSTISEQILSRARLQALIIRYGLYADPRKRVPHEEVIEWMRRDIEIEARGGSDARFRDRGGMIAFSVAYRGGDPRTVAEVANTLASSYVEENVRARQRQAVDTSEILKAKLEETRGRLEQHERHLREFKARPSAELPQNLDVNLGIRERLRMQLQGNADSQAQARQRREALAQQDERDESASAPGGGAVPPDPSVARLLHLRQELAQLRARYTDEHPNVRVAQAEIARMEQVAGQTRSMADRPPTPPAVPGAGARTKEALAAIDSEMRILSAEEAHLRAALARFQPLVGGTRGREPELREVSRDYQSTLELHATLLKRYEEAQLAESMEERKKAEQFRILNPAIVSALPIAPKRGKLMLLGLVLSSALAAAAVLAREALDRSFDSADELRAVTGPVPLVTIPKISTPLDVQRERRRRRVALTATLLMLGGIVGAAYYVAHGNEQLVSVLARGRT